MTTKEVSQMIASIGLPYAYDHFEAADTPGQPPFVCFIYPGSDNFFADDSVYQKIKQLRIELYTNEKEPALEKRVEDALDAAELPYNSSESYIDSEKMYMVTWDTSIVLTEEE